MVDNFYEMHMRLRYVPMLLFLNMSKERLKHKHLHDSGRRKILHEQIFDPRTREVQVGQK